MVKGVFFKLIIKQNPKLEKHLLSVRFTCVAVPL